MFKELKKELAELKAKVDFISARVARYCDSATSVRGELESFEARLKEAEAKAEAGVKAETPKPILSLPALTAKEFATANDLYHSLENTQNQLTEEATLYNELQQRLESQECDLESARIDYGSVVETFVDFRDEVRDRILSEWDIELTAANAAGLITLPLEGRNRLAAVRDLLLKCHEDIDEHELDFVFDKADKPSEAPYLNECASRLEAYDIDEVYDVGELSLGLSDYFSFQKTPEVEPAT